MRPEPVGLGGQCRGETVDGGDCVHPTDQQREPLPGHRVGAHEVRGRPKAKGPGGLADSLGCQVVSPARRQVDGPVTDAADHAVRQQAGQGSVNGRGRLIQDARQLRRIDERHPAEEVEQLSVGEGHVVERSRAEACAAAGFRVSGSNVGDVHGASLSLQGMLGPATIASCSSRPPLRRSPHHRREDEAEGDTQYAQAYHVGRMQEPLFCCSHTNAAVMKCCFIHSI